MADLSTDTERRHRTLSMESRLSPNGTALLDRNSGSDDISDVRLADGGYGWVVVGASFFNMFCLDGLISIYGLLYPELLVNFGADPAITALPGSIVVGMSCLLGPLCSELIQRFGFRQVTVLGSCVTSVGLLCSYAMESITVFLFTHGILTGIGCCFFYLPSITLVNTYFDRKRGIASGIITAGSGLGVIVLSPLTQFLMDYYGWKGTILLWAGFMLNICVSGLLMRPPPPPPQTKGGNNSHADTSKVVTESHNESVSSNKQHENGGIHNGRVQHKFVYGGNIEHSSTRSLPHRSIDRHGSVSEHRGPYRSLQCVNQPKHKQHKQTSTCVPSVFDRKDIFLTGSTNVLKTYASHRSVHSKRLEEMELTDITDVEITSYMTSESDIGRGLCNCKCKPFTKDPAFLLLVIGSALAQMAQHIPMTFLADYCELIGLEDRDIASLFIIFGVLNMAGRLAGGLLTSVRMFSPLGVCNVGSVVCALACFLFWLCTSFERLAVFIAVYGFFVGFSCATQPLITLEYVGLDNLTPAFGLITMAKGPAAMVGPPLAGGLYQLTQNYTYSIIFPGGLLLLTAILMAVMPFVGKYRLQKQEAPEIVATSPSLDTTDTGERGSRANHL